MRAAVVGGGAYVAGKKVAQRSAEQGQQENEQDERLATLEEQAPATPDPPAQDAPAGDAPAGDAPAADAPAAPPSMPDQLSQLAALHEQGALTDDEFATAKARLLGG
jgi:Short C-terminal domain